MQSQLQLHNRNAFTLVEMLIAVGILSLLLVSAYSLFSYAQKSFNVGSWQLSTQKKAQTFLLRFKETIEKSNHAYSIETNAERRQIGGSRDILIDSAYFNKLASSTNKIIMCGSISSPNVVANPELRSDGHTGIWKGYALQCFNKKLKLYQTGNWNSMDPSPPAVIGTADPSLFVLNNTVGDFNIELEDVDSIGVWAQTATGTSSLSNPEVLITCSIKMIKPNSRANVTESITAKVSDRLIDQVVSQTLGGTSR